MKITNVRWDREQGYPILRCKIDGRDAVIGHEQKPTMTRFKFVFLGSEFSDYVAIAPPELEAIARVKEFRGFTNDPDFYDNIFLPFAQAVRNGSFEVGDR